MTISNSLRQSILKSSCLFFSQDYAASEFIVREAGGITIDPSGGNFDLMSRRLIVANSIELANQLSQDLVQYYPLPRDDA